MWDKLTGWHQYFPATGFGIVFYNVLSPDTFIVFQGGIAIIILHPVKGVDAFLIENPVIINIFEGQFGWIVVLR